MIELGYMAKRTVARPGWLDVPNVRDVYAVANCSSPSTGFDHDDIYSGMPTSPLDAIRERKNRQWLVVFGVPAIAAVGDLPAITVVSHESTDSDMLTDGWHPAGDGTALDVGAAR